MPGSVDFSDVAESTAPSIGAQLLFTQVASGDAIDRERAENDRDEIMAAMKDQLEAGAMRTRPRNAGRGRGSGRARAQPVRAPPRRRRSVRVGRNRQHPAPAEDDFTDAADDEGVVPGQFDDSDDDASDIESLLPLPKTSSRARIGHGDIDVDDDDADDEDADDEDDADDGASDEYAFAGTEEAVPLPKRDHSAYKPLPDPPRTPQRHAEARQHRRRHPEPDTADHTADDDDDAGEPPLPPRDNSPEAVQMRRQALLMRLRDLITAGYTPTRPESYFAECGEDELGFEVSYGEKYIDREQWVTWMCQGLLLGFGGIHRLNKQFGPFIHTERLPARARASQTKFNGPLREIYDRHLAGSGPSNPFVKLGMAIGMVVVANHFAEEDEIRRDQGMPSAAAGAASAPPTAPTTAAPAPDLDPIPEPPPDRPLLENIAD